MIWLKLKVSRKQPICKKQSIQNIKAVRLESKCSVVSLIWSEFLIWLLLKNSTVHYFLKQFFTNNQPKLFCLMWSLKLYKKLISEWLQRSLNISSKHLRRCIFFKKSSNKVNLFRSWKWHYGELLTLWRQMIFACCNLFT